MVDPADIGAHGPQLAEPRQFRLGIIGYGEIGHGLALGLARAGLGSIAAFQRAPHSSLTIERAAASNVRLVGTPAELALSSDIIVAVTQGSQSMTAVRSISSALDAQHCYIDLASATPQTKRHIALELAASGALFADGVIEGSPLEHEHRFRVIVSGPGAQTFADTLNPWGMRISIASAEVGRAAAIKGLRHILMKGQIALLIECSIAAKRYGISDEVFASVAEWYDALPFMTNASRLLRTTTVHAGRRADEAQMAQSIMEELGIDPIMTRATVEVLRKVEALGLRQQLGGVVPTSSESAIDLIEAYNK